MACGKASSPTQPRLTGCSAIPPNAISAAKYWRRAYVYRAAVQTTKMQEWRVVTSSQERRTVTTKTTAQSIGNTGHWGTFRLSSVKIMAVKSLQGPIFPGPSPKSSIYSFDKGYHTFQGFPLYERGSQETSVTPLVRR